MFWRLTLGDGETLQSHVHCLVRYLIDVKIDCIPSLSSCSKLGMFL